MRGSRSAGDLDSAVRALIGRVAREATPRKAREDQAGAGVIVCVHDNPASGELSLVGDGRDEAVLAIRRTCQGSMRAELIATAERLERREGCRGDERQTTSTGSSRSGRSCSTSTARRPMIDQAHPARRPGHRRSPGRRANRRVKARGSDVPRPRSAPCGARRGSRGCGSGRTDGAHTTVHGLSSPRAGRVSTRAGAPPPPRLVRFAQRTGAPISAAHAARVLALWGGCGSTVVRHACLSVGLRSGPAGGSA